MQRHLDWLWQPVELTLVMHQGYPSVQVALTCRAAHAALEAEVADTRLDYWSFLDIVVALIGDEADGASCDAAAVATCFGAGCGDEWSD